MMQSAVEPNQQTLEASVPLAPDTLNERLMLALVGSNQIAFDWQIVDDVLHFSGELENGLKGTPLNVSKIWRSAELPALMHESDLALFRARLHNALKGQGQGVSAFHEVEVRLRDEQRGWRWISIAGKIVERDAKGRALRMVGTFSDIDERKRRDSEIASREKLKSAILTAAIDCIVTVNERGRIVSFNEAAEQAFGRLEQDVRGKSLQSLIATPEGGIFPAPEGADINARFPLNQRIELSGVRADGSVFPIELAMVELPVQGHRAFTAFIRDITDRKHVEALQLGKNRILDMVANGTPLPEVLSAIQHLTEALAGKGRCSIALNRIVISAGIASTKENHGPVETRGNRRAGFVRPINDKDGTTLGTFMLAADLPASRAEQLADNAVYLASLAIQRRMADEKMRFLAHYDGLTGLPNRFLFREHFDLALKSARRHGKKFAVCFIDLDKFKEVNDTLGHDAGDEVLRVVAQRMRGVLRHTDKIARMGGDEFYVLLEDLGHGCHAAEVAEKLLEEASRAVRIGDVECKLSASIGISIYPDDGRDEETLLERADSAMYKAKKSGKNAYRFFSTDVHRALTKSSLAVREALRGAGMRCSLPRDMEFALRG